MNALSDHEAVIELLSLMKGNGRKLQATALSSMLSSIDNIDNKYSEIFASLKAMRTELYDLADQCHALGVDTPGLSVYQVMEQEAGHVLTKAASVKGMIIDFAKSSLEDFKQLGVSALDTSIPILKIYGMRNTLHKQACNSGLSIIITHIIDSIEQEGGFQSAFLVPLRAARNKLSSENNPAFAALGCVKNLDQTAEVVREVPTERSAAKKPSIRQDIKEKRIQVAARPTPDKAVKGRTDKPELF